MDDQQEREVARGLQEGRTEAWRTLYEAYCQRVWRSVARMMGPAEAADVSDVVQETFLAAARSARSFDPARGSLWLWLGGIARRHVALYYRNRKRHDRLKRAGEFRGVDNRQVVRWLDGDQGTPAAALASAETASLVRAVLTELSADYETLLTAKYFDGATVEQIAGQRQCTATAVRSRLARARRAFRRVFAKTSTRSVDRQASEHDES